MRKSNTLKSPAATTKTIRHIGLDVHKDTIAVAVAEERGEPQFLKTISHDLHAVEKMVKELPEGGRHEKFVLEETLQSIDRAVLRLGQLEAHLETVVADWRMKPVVEALQSLRGIAFIAASVLVSELGDLSRFEHPKQLMAFLGLVTNERSTGTSRRQGAITKCGNGHARIFHPQTSSYPCDTCFFRVDYFVSFFEKLHDQRRKREVGTRGRDSVKNC